MTVVCPDSGVIFSQLDVRHLPTIWRQGRSHESGSSAKIDIMRVDGGERKKMKNQISDGGCAAWRAATCDGLLGYIMFGLEASKFAFFWFIITTSTKQKHHPQRITSLLNSCFIFYKHLLNHIYRV